MSFFKKLENQTLIAAFVGLFVGGYLPQIQGYHAWLGNIYVTLLKMIMIPLVVITLMHSLTKLSSDRETFKFIGLGVLGYYLLSSLLASFNGLLMANIFSLDGSYAGGQASNLASLSFEDILLSFFSKNIFKSLATGDLVPIIVFTIIFSVFIGKSQLKKDSFFEVLDLFNDVLSKLTTFIIKFTPIGVFSLVAVMMNKLDWSQFQDLDKFFMAVGTGMSIHFFITVPTLIWFFTKRNPYAFMWNVREALIVAFFSQSSSATIPVSMRVLEENEGVQEKVFGVSIPVGATLNMDGSAFYHAILLMFMAKLNGITLGLGEQVILLLMCQVSSAGAAGIPNGGIMMMTMMLSVIGIPPEMIGLYVLVDRFWDLPITSVNVFGDLAGAKIIDHRLSKSSS